MSRTRILFLTHSSGQGVKSADSLNYYLIPPHKQNAYIEWNELSFPITENIHDEVLSLPISLKMNEAEKNIIVKYLNNYLT